MGAAKRLAPPALVVALIALALPASAFASQTLTVEKVGSGTGTVASFPSGINCGTTCQASFADNATVTLTASWSSPTLPVKWGGCDSVNGEGKCIVAMSAPRTVIATFSLAQVGLTVKEAGSATGTVTSSPAGIECGSKCQASFDKGTTVTLSGIPGPKAEAVQWSGCDSVNGEDKCLVAMSGAKEVTATFNLGSQLTVSKAGTGAGTVTSTPAGIECGQVCSAGFAKAATVTLKGAPGLHTQPVKWSGCDNVIGADECLVSMSSDRAVSATFALEPQWVEYLVSVRTIGTGKGTVTSLPTGIECPGTCRGEYVFNSSLTLIATPAPGSEFDHWSVSACGASTTCTTTVRSSRRIDAIFVAVGKRTLSVAKAGSGQGTVLSKPAGIECGAKCSAELDVKTKVVLSATASPGSTFTGWSGEGCSGAKTCRVLMNEVRDVTASFAKSPAPPGARCVVPNLKGKTLAKARSALAAAHCALGKVRRPKGAKLSHLRVRSFSPAAGSTLPAGSKVALKLARTKRR